MKTCFFPSYMVTPLWEKKNADFLADDTHGAKMSKRCGGVPAVCYQGLFVLESGTGSLLSKINFVVQTEPFQSV